MVLGSSKYDAVYVANCKPMGDGKIDESNISKNPKTPKIVKSNTQSMVSHNLIRCGTFSSIREFRGARMEA